MREKDRRTAAARPSTWLYFDEAHKLSWSDPNRRDSKTTRYQLAEVLSRRVPNLLLLTATPHMGKGVPVFCPVAAARLRGLLNLRTLSAPCRRENGNRHFLRRLKEEMVTYDGQPIYKPRLTQTIPVTLRPKNEPFTTRRQQYLQWSYEHIRGAQPQRRGNGRCRSATPSGEFDFCAHGVLAPNQGEASCRQDAA